MYKTGLIRFLETFSDKCLLLDDEQNGYSYSDLILLCRSDQFSETKGRLVICLIENNIHSLIGYLALIISGAVPMLIPANINNRFLKKYIEDFKPKYIWSPRSINVNMDDFSIKKTIGDYNLIGLKQKDFALNASLALLLSTSGTTGSSKFVRLSKLNLLSNASSIVKYLSLNSSETPITTLPPNYSFGLSIIHSHVLVGAKLLVTKKTFFDEIFWDFLKESKATSLSGVPFHFEMLKKVGLERLKSSSITSVTQAGGALSSKLGEEFASFFKKNNITFFIMYGQTEASPRISYLDPIKSTLKIKSIGSAIPKGKLWLENEKGERIQKPNTAGELIYKGPNVYMGYANSYLDLAKGYEGKKVLRTGDLAKNDADGDFYIVGRISRFIKLFGNRISLTDLEKKVERFGYECACANNDDSLNLFVKNIELNDAAKIKKMLVKDLKFSKNLIKIYGLVDFPRSESGKILYPKLRKEIGNRLA